MADGSRKRRLDLDDGPAGAATPSGSSSPSKQPRPAVGSGAAAGGYGSDAPTTNPLNGRPYSAKYHDLRKTRMSLPVFQFLDQLEGHLRSNQVVIVEGETGSGKTTQVRALVYLQAPHAQLPRRRGAGPATAAATSGQRGRAPPVLKQGRSAAVPAAASFRSAARGGYGQPPQLGAVPCCRSRMHRGKRSPPCADI